MLMFKRSGEETTSFTDSSRMDSSTESESEANSPLETCCTVGCTTGAIRFLEQKGRTHTQNDPAGRTEGK